MTVGRPASGQGSKRVLTPQSALYSELEDITRLGSYDHVKQGDTSKIEFKGTSNYKNNDKGTDYFKL